MKSYQDYKKIIEGISSPSLFLDLEAFRNNIQWIKKHSPHKKIRIASKSIRSKEILRRVLSSDSIFEGLMTFDLREALWLRDEGFKNILMGYPTMDIQTLNEYAKKTDEITLMVDLAQHLFLLQNLAEKHDSIINICIDIDLSLELPTLRFGVYRSSINSIKKLKVFLNELKKCPRLNLVGLMGYEAQIAGVMDKNSFGIKILKQISHKKLTSFRRESVEIIKNEGYNLQFINGGGTGSLFETVKEDCVTEITVGSGLYAPVLFDYYQNIKLSPALFFSLPIVRKPLENIYTCFGGGYIASGAIQKIKGPTPYLPVGMKLLPFEGGGEVQTPIQYDGSETLTVGDSVFFRHAKAGEICERFDKINLIENGIISGEVKTYRGEGKTFV
jgi:D-serine deaminase-like pyridoxal phosphate-dependent protein